VQARVDYICNKLYNPTAALSLINQIEHMYGLLEDNPYMGEEHMTIGGRAYRFVLIKNYMLFFLVQGQQVVISRFLYGPSDYDCSLDNG